MTPSKSNRIAVGFFAAAMADVVVRFLPVAAVRSVAVRPGFRLVALRKARNRDDFFAWLQADQSHTLSVSSAAADLRHTQPNQLPRRRDEHDLVVIGHH